MSHRRTSHTQTPEARTATPDTRRLGDACTVIRGVSFDKSMARRSSGPGYLPLLRAGNIGDALILNEDLVWVPDACISAVQRLYVGDVAICMSSGSASVVGKTAQLREPWNGSVGAFCAIIRPGRQLDASYLGLWLRSPAFISWRDAQVRGANIQNLRVSQLAEIPIRLPALAEQKRIAAWLGEQLASADRARAAAISRLEAATSLGRATLRSLFLGREGQQWPRRPLGDICRLVNGDAYRDSDWSDSGTPIVRIQNLNDPTKGFNHWAGGLDDRVLIDSGDVLLAWSGTPGTSFGAHLWSRGRAVLNQHIFRVDLDRTQVVPEWAVFAINEQLDEMIGRAHGAVGLRHVTKGEVERLKVPLPDLAKQRKVVQDLAGQLAVVHKLELAVAREHEVLDRLPAALLRQAFNGDA